MLATPRGQLLRISYAYEDEALAMKQNTSPPYLTQQAYLTLGLKV